MTGSLLYRRSDDPPDAYVRAVIALDDGSELRYADLRKLGQIWLVDSPEEAVGKLGPEPLDAAFTAAKLRATPVGPARANQGRPPRPAGHRRHRQHLRRRGAFRRPHPSTSTRRRPNRSGSEATAPRHPTRPQRRPGQPWLLLPRLRRRRRPRGDAPVACEGLSSDGAGVLCLRRGDSSHQSGRTEHALLPALPARGRRHGRCHDKTTV